MAAGLHGIHGIRGAAAGKPPATVAWVNGHYPELGCGSAVFAGGSVGPRSRLTSSISVLRNAAWFARFSLW